MQYTAHFYALLAVATAAVAAALPASGDPDAPVANAHDLPGYLVSRAQMMHWLATTDVELTFTGDPINPLASHSAQDTIVVYCSTRTAQNTCGAPCTVYNGGAMCLNAPNTACIVATNNVGFCSSPMCTGACNELQDCGTRLDNGFCFTPDTKSILVSDA